MHNILKTTAFRWAFAIAVWSSLLSLLLFAFVYWRTVTFAQEQLDHLLLHEARFAAAVPAESAHRLKMWLEEDLHSVRFAGLFAADGRPLAGNLGYLPPDLVADGAAQRVQMSVQLGGQAVSEERSRDGARSVEEFRQTIDQALVWLDQTLSLITAVLRIGEIEHERRRAAFRPFALTPMLREVAESYEPIAEERAIRLTLDIATRDQMITGDCDLMFEAVANLVDNAVKFTPAGGSVRIGLSERSGDPLITVEDTGPGIPPEERAQVFKRFYRSAPERHSDGNGLGLSIVAAIAGLHGFTVKVLEAPGGGCRFEIACHRTPAGNRSDMVRTAAETTGGGALGCHAARP